MTVRCDFREKDGNLLLSRTITGNVRLFGGSLKGTYDFAKKATKMADENFHPWPHVPKARKRFEAIGLTPRSIRVINQTAE
jgi:hypothetical protein